MRSAPRKRSVKKSVSELRHDVKLLEKLVEKRKKDLELLEDPNADQKDYTEELEAVTTEVEDLTNRNNLLRRQVKHLRESERIFSADPRVQDKRNEVTAVHIQMSEIEEEIDTLRIVKRRRDRALGVIDRSEKEARAFRNQQAELNSETKTLVKSLSEQLKELQREDLEYHEKCAVLQDAIKTGITNRDKEGVEQTIRNQEDELKELVASKKEWRHRKDAAKEESRRGAEQEKRDCERLEFEIAKLRDILSEKTNELKRSYADVGRAARVPSRILAAL